MDSETAETFEQRKRELTLELMGLRERYGELDGDLGRWKQKWLALYNEWDDFLNGHQSE
jgi:hypothetical protein